MTGTLTINQHEEHKPILSPEFSKYLEERNLQIGGLAVGMSGLSLTSRKEALSDQAIRRRANEIAQQLRIKFAGEKITLLTTLEGASIWSNMITEELAGFNQIPFASESGVRLDPVDIQFASAKVSTYSGTRSQVAPSLAFPLKPELISDRNVIIIEDIVDTGNTAAFLRETVRNMVASSTLLCAMLDKPSGRENPNNHAPDIIGYTLDGDQFVIGMGLDVDNQGRELRGIYNIIN